MVRVNFGELKKGDVFYKEELDNEDKMIKCVKCEHYDQDLTDKILGTDWEDIVTNVVWLENGLWVEAGTLDWFFNDSKVWINETN